jgi:hypothetical protein
MKPGTANLLLLLLNMRRADLLSQPLLWLPHVPTTPSCVAQLGARLPAMEHLCRHFPASAVGNTPTDIALCMLSSCHCRVLGCLRPPSAAAAADVPRSAICAAAHC